MTRARPFFLFASVAFLFPTVAVTSAAPPTFDFVVIATTEMQIPGQPEGILFSNIPVPAMRGGNVVFRGEGDGAAGIYAYRKGELEMLADRNTLVPGDPLRGNFVGLSAPSLDESFNVTFKGEGERGLKGIYTVVDGKVALIADTNTSIPNELLGTTFTDFSSPWISNGNVVFRGTGPEGIDGIYTNAGGSLRRVAATNTLIPGGVGSFSGFGTISTVGPQQAPSIGGTTIAFYGEGSDGQQGIYAEVDGTLTRIADTNTEIPGGGGATFPGFDVSLALSSITYDGGVVFAAGLDSDPHPNGLGIFKWWSGSLMKIADPSTVVSGTDSTLTSFGETQGISFYKDEYSFLGDGPGSPQGIYAILDGQLIKVLVNNEFLEGKRGLAMGSYGQGIEDGSIAFNIGNWLGVRANVVAIQEHRWLGVGSSVYEETGTGVDWEDKANWSFGAVPRAVVPTIIDPDGAATIHGPISDTQLASLEVGEGNGVATLWLLNGALITTPSTTIHAKGVLAGEGRISGPVTNHGVIRPDDISTGDIVNNGLIDIATAASRLSTGGSSIVNHGIVHVEGLLSTGSFPSSIVNYGTIDGDGTVTTETLTNNGDLRVATLAFKNELINNGRIEARRIESGSVDIDNQRDGEILLLGGDALINEVAELHNSGVIRGSGRINAHVFENNSDGEIRVGAGNRMIVDNGSDASNAGLMEVIKGELEFKDSIVNGTSAMIAARDATLRFGGGGLANSGAVAVSFGTTDVFGDIDNRAAGANPAGSIVLTGSSNTTFFGDVTNDGSFQISAGSAAVFFGSFTGANGTTGGGDVFLEGDLRPGNSPGLQSFGGNVHFGELANLEIEIGGTSKGSQYDALDIAGTATLDGLLGVSLLGDFEPGAGDAFEILTAAGGVTGTFATELLPALAGDLFWNINYDADSVSLAVAAPGLPGDYNQDGSVDAADYVMWRKTDGAPEGYNTWRANFGRTAEVGAASRAALSPRLGEPTAAVPEPSAIFLSLGLAGTLLASRRMRPTINPARRAASTQTLHR